MWICNTSRRILRLQAELWLVDMLMHGADCRKAFINFPKTLYIHNSHMTVFGRHFVAGRNRASSKIFPPCVK